MPMAPPPVSRRPRMRGAAVQRVSEGLSRAVTTQRRAGGGTIDRTASLSYQDWQSWARRFARSLGVARFAASIVADTCARCILRIEEQDPATGDWHETENPSLTGVFNAYRNTRQRAPELVKMHVWHYQVAGELAQVISDGPAGVDWSIFSMAAIDFREKRTAEFPNGSALIKTTPSGTVRDGTAFEVPREQVTRFWLPDEEWQAYATSPMAASIDDLKRYHSLARMVQRTVDSRLVMNGVFWTPGQAHEAYDNEQTAGDGSSSAASSLSQDYMNHARKSYSDDDDVASIAPFEMHWDSEWGEPKFIDVGRDLDPNALAHRKEALEDFARGSNLPASLIVGGGPGDKNHWSEWLVDDKFFDAAIAPTMDRVTHEDLTATFLVPVLRVLRLPPEQYRCGYDPAPVIVHPDQSDIALRYFLAGLLGGDATLRAANFDPDDKMDFAELHGRLMEVLGKGGDGPAAPLGVRTQGQSTGPAQVTQGPPPLPPPLQAAVDAAGKAMAEAVATANGDGPAVPTARVNRMLRALTRANRRTGRRLLAGAEVALEEAMRAAGTKLAVRARNAKNRPAGVRRAALEAVDNGDVLGSHIAAIGITQQELLRGRFDTYNAVARRMLADHREQQRRALEQGGIDDPDRVLADESHGTRAAGFLAAALTALAVQRLTDGPPAVPPIGEVSGAVPASVVSQALRIADGQAAPRLGATIDEAPSLVEEAPPLAQRAFDELGAEQPIEYTWEHGFYGDPTQPFDVHEDLGASAFTTLDRENDPDLPPTPFGDRAQPGDHDGCTCEWVPTAGTESGPGDRPVVLPR